MVLEEGAPIPVVLEILRQLLPLKVMMVVVLLGHIMVQVAVAELVRLVVKE